METFLGTKCISATPMTLGAYNEHRGWTIPDEDPDTAGYLVVYPDGYKSWSPQLQFDEAYRADGHFNFGHAVYLLKEGFRVARSGWNGKGMFLFLVAGSNNLTVNREPLLSILGEGAKFTYQPHVDMFTADGTIVPWLCSQSDMLAEDWCIVPDA